MPPAAWLGLDATLVATGLVLLAGLGYTVWRQVRALARDLQRTGQRLSAAAARFPDAVEVSQNRR